MLFILKDKQHLCVSHNKAGYRLEQMLLGNTRIQSHGGVDEYLKVEIAKLKLQGPKKSPMVVGNSTKNCGGWRGELYQLVLSKYLQDSVQDPELFLGLPLPPVSHLLIPCSLPQTHYQLLALGQLHLVATLLLAWGCVLCVSICRVELPLLFPVPRCIVCLECCMIVVCVPYRIYTILCVYEVCIMCAAMFTSRCMYHVSTI